MREITEHKVNPANDRLRITIEDEPGAGGANCRYLILGFNTASNPSRGDAPEWHGLNVLFQNGPVTQFASSVNGVTHEALLAIIVDRLRSFQAGPYSCKEYACALTHIEEALHWLQSCTLKRMQRGVEGTHTV